MALNTRIENRDLRKLKLLERNARFMTNTQFQRLVENVRKDKKLTSVPLVYSPPGAFDAGEELVLSGNHRVQAAIEAGVYEGEVMLVLDQQSKDELLARQLSHNAIAGQDDDAVLAQLYDEIEDVDWREYSGLDDDQLNLMEKASVEPLSEVGLEFQSVSLIFLPHELSHATEVWEQAKDAAGGADEVWIAPMKAYELTLDTLASAHGAYGVTNVTTALGLVLELATRHLEEMREGWITHDYEPKQPKQWVPIETVLGGRSMPAEAAALLTKAVDRMVSAGDVPGSQRWKALEYLAGDFLAGPEMGE
jgi:hypothetical protein